VSETREIVGNTVVFQIPDLLPSWERSLRARNLSAATIDDYLTSARKLDRWLADQSMPRDVTWIAREHIEAYLVAGQDRGLSPGSVASQFRRLQQLFKWLHAEGETTANAMVNMEPPKVPVVPPRIMPDEDILALFKVTAGTDFLQRRDTGINRLFFDSGMRLGQMAGIEVPHIDWRADTIRTHAKGDKYIDAPFGSKTGEALDRYLRARARHRFRDLPWLWLGKKGRLTGTGIYQMTVRRAEEAKIEHVHPHLWRHAFAHHWCLADGSESQLMRLMGWDSPDMARRYGASAADERARRKHRELRLGDRL